MPIGSLVKMANQIVENQRYRKRDDAVASVAQHLKLFWTPLMLSDIKSHIDGGAPELDSIAIDAITSITQ